MQNNYFTTPEDWVTGMNLYFHNDAFTWLEQTDKAHSSKIGQISMGHMIQGHINLKNLEIRIFLIQYNVILYAL